MSKGNESYHDELNKKNILKLRELISTLPSFCREFFRGIEPTTSSRTRIAYAYDLRIFFTFLHDTNSYCRKHDITSYPVSLLDDIKKVDIEEYLEYISYYKKDDQEFINNERGKMRKLSTLKTLYHYYFNGEVIESNPAALVSMPKLHEKEIIRLDPNEVVMLLNYVENGENLTKGQSRYHAKNKLRDLALLTLMLGTGIRVSECVGLDLNHLDFNNGSIKITRKGGYESIVYFGEEVEIALLDYKEERMNRKPLKGHENALFLSMQNKRLCVRAVENLVKKHASSVTPLKAISPHKLRSTYGTNLYKETGDIYLVADVLGHKDVNTTRKNYAALDDERRRSAANKVTLREKN